MPYILLYALRSSSGIVKAPRGESFLHVLRNLCTMQPNNNGKIQNGETILRSIAINCSNAADFRVKMCNFSSFPRKICGKEGENVVKSEENEGL